MTWPFTIRSKRDVAYFSPLGNGGKNGYCLGSFLSGYYLFETESPMQRVRFELEGNTFPTSFRRDFSSKVNVKFDTKYT